MSTVTPNYGYVPGTREVDNTVDHPGHRAPLFDALTEAANPRLAAAGVEADGHRIVRDRARRSRGAAVALRALVGHVTGQIVAVVAAPHPSGGCAH